ncbi:MAG: hypothetical protein IJ242_09870, partial [Clostridia bacterium]|nr:hypothetical protein [Clostridia bacterium]
QSGRGFQKGFQGVSLRGFRGFQIFLWELCVCIKNLNVWESADAPACFLLEMRAFMQRKQQQIHLNGRLSPPAYGR